ncbi:hypothetical protein CTI51_18585 [Pseudomonas syringae pv. actinidiae]|nr:hypothetical protein CTI51_18585 [Pseudomonas syringae pv. actinidiae]
MPAHSRTSPHKSSWIPVGVNLFAKALFQTQKMHRLYRPLREQVRSHKSSWMPVGANLFAKADLAPEKRIPCQVPQ